MSDFKGLIDGRITLDELIVGLDKEDLDNMTNEMIDTVQSMISECVDSDVVFTPDDPYADDPYAQDPDDIAMPWSLGHVIVHITASSEESAALAAELARGVEFHGRSRYEVPWQDVETIDYCRERLEESRRMRIASLDMWQDDPFLGNFYQSWEGGPIVNAFGRFVLGLVHDFSHLAQIQNIVQQASNARQFN